MRQNRSNLFLGFLLILLGSWMVVTKQVPAVQHWISENYIWPMWVIGAGALIFLMGLISGNPEMAIPASIVAGLGGIFYYQELHNNYGTWSFMWTLIPGFVGVGHILAGLLGERTRHNLSHGLRNLVVSAVLFLVFGTLLGGLNLLGDLGAPILIILLGVYVMARGIMRGGRVKHEPQ
jgi:hypothetical protein